MASHFTEQYAPLFNAACRDHKNDQRRALLAVALQSDSDPMVRSLGEYIHVECLLSNDDTPETVYKEHWPRKRELESRYHEHWWADILNPFPGIRLSPFFERGMPTEVWCATGHSFASNAAALFALFPISSVSFTSLETFNILSELAELSHVSRLILEDLSLGVDDGVAISNCRYLTNLKSLHLANNRLGDEGTVALAQSDGLTNLCDLDLGNNSVGDAGARALATSKFAANLHHLGLEGSTMSDRGAESLALWPDPSQLTGLTMWNCDNLTVKAELLLEDRFGGSVSFDD